MPVFIVKTSGSPLSCLTLVTLVVACGVIMMSCLFQDVFPSLNIFFPFISLLVYPLGCGIDHFSSLIASTQTHAHKCGRAGSWPSTPIGPHTHTERQDCHSSGPAGLQDHNSWLMSHTFSLLGEQGLQHLRRQTQIVFHPAGDSNLDLLDCFHKMCFI